MIAINTIVDCRDHSKDEAIVVETSNADIGFFEGSLTYLNIPKNSDYDTIEAYAFADFPDLEEVFVPKTISSMKKNSFVNCPKLKKIVLGRKSSKTLEKTKPWGAPADCEIVYDAKATPRE